MSSNTHACTYRGDVSPISALIFPRTSKRARFTSSSKDIRAAKHLPDCKTVCLDKIVLLTSEDYSPGYLLNTLSRRAAGGGFKVTIKSGAYESEVWWKVRSDDRTLIRGNPSDFPTWSHFENALVEMFEQDVLDAKVTSLDAAATFPVPYDELFPGIDFGRRRSTARWGDRSTGRSFYVGRRGKKHEVIVYDKKRESDLDHEATRLEITFSLKDLTLRDVPKRVMECKPFKRITLNRVRFQAPPIENKRLHERFIEFKCRTKSEGLWWTARQLNDENDRNFAKRYGGFFTIAKVTPTLNQMWWEGIPEFFGQ